LTGNAYTPLLARGWQVTLPAACIFR